MADVQLFELLYTAEQTESCSLYTPLRIDNKRPEWRELQAYIEIYEKKIIKNQSFVGVFSPKFEVKTHISVSAFLDFVVQNTDCDVCFINPFPQITTYSYNVWMQGEIAHPGLLELAQALLDAVGIDWELTQTPRQASNVLAYANFWVANPTFWEGYVGGVLNPIATFMATQPDHPVVQALLSPTIHTDKAPYLPFIIERLFSTYLSFNSQLQTAAYPFTTNEIAQKYCLNDFERLLYQQMHEEVESADNQTESEFPTALKQKMQMVTMLRQQHWFDYYASRPHPHTGRVFVKE